MEVHCLVIQTAFLGDIILTTPLIAKLQQKKPCVIVHVVTTPAGAEALKGLPQVIVHILDKKKEALLSGFVRLWRQLRQYKFEAVYCVHRSPRSLLLGRMVKAAQYFAFQSFWARLLGYETKEYLPYSPEIHYVDRVLKLDENSQQRTLRSRPLLAVLPADSSQIQDKISVLQGKPYCVISPFSHWGTKMWLPQRFQALAQWLLKVYPWGIVFVGEATVAQESWVRGVCQSFGGRVVSLVNQTSIGELKALISEARLLISNDSAPVHIAAAFNRPTVAIFGPTVKKWGFFPLSEQSAMVERQDIPCRPCSLHGPQKCPKVHFDCMGRIEVSEVTQVIEALVARSL